MRGPLTNSTTFALMTAALVTVAAGVSARRMLAPRTTASLPTPSASPSASLGAGAVAARGADLVLEVPHAPGSILLDGDTDDPGWTGDPNPARTRDFLLPNGAPSRPFSEIRMVWGDGYLYLSLYAADEDIESRTAEADGPLWLDDAFRVVFATVDATAGDPATEYAIEVSPRAVITDSIRHRGGSWDYTWNSGAHASRELDGTLNDPSNMDEEWVVELAVPFESLGLRGRPGETLGFSASRCDTPRAGGRTCASWGQSEGRGQPRGRIVLQ